MCPVSVMPESVYVSNNFCFSKINFGKLKKMMSVQIFHAGEPVYREGDPIEALYFVHSGRVKETKLSEEGKEYTVSLYHSGDFFGRLDPFLDSTHSLAARALQTSEIGILIKSDLEFLIRQHRELAIEFMNWIEFMRQISLTKYRDLLMYGKPGALCSMLIRLSNSYGVQCKEGIQISLKLTNTELADFIGCARESVSRMLGGLKKAGAITVNDGLITITDLNYLQNVCRCELCPKELCRI